MGGVFQGCFTMQPVQEFRLFYIVKAFITVIPVKRKRGKCTSSKLVISILPKLYSIKSCTMTGELLQLPGNVIQYRASVHQAQG
ncbi:hypothetical protein LX66_3602 [Chitinophaga japonensis]|uniref:Uncharacterized protein n=1 Tax=Chitinophaga japonensis TaxID=104662 RepID=A0A562SYC9_CHIJA|nr:hypothetical protein LX66_3602 [Chitinophaga japonensis]